MIQHRGWLQNDPSPRTNPLADKPKASKRQRHVYPSNEIPHLWAHKTQESARNAQGNFYFDGDTIYSYGSHFPIAQHITKGKKSAVLLTTRTHSSTTAGHVSAVRQSIPSGITVFEVPSVYMVGQAEQTRNIEHFQSEAKDALKNAQNGWKYARYSLERAFDAREDARKYAKFFGLKTPNFSFLPKGKALAALKAQIAERRARCDVQDKARNEKEQAARAERQRIAALALPEKIALWRAGKNVGSNRWELQSCPVMLRISGNEVETSYGARVPVAHAVALLATVRKVKARGEEFVSNGHTIPIGVYKVDRIEKDGTLHAGCHVISFQEIEQLAPALEALTTVTA